MQERLFAAYFTEGRDMGDAETLVGLGAEIGLDPSETRTVIAGGQFADDVRRECQDAEKLGAGGVPFFVIDRKYGFTGAQPSDLILEILTKAWSGQVEEAR
jgi:predicted DsbA family dithiol-disulfide isomerase